MLGKLGIYTNVYSFSFVSLVNKVRMLLLLKLWYADLSITSAIQIPEPCVNL